MFLCFYQSYFSDSYIIKEILITHSNNLNDKTLEHSDSIKVDISQLLIIFSDMYQTFSNSAILELYINLLFDGANDLESQSKFALKTKSSN